MSILSIAQEGATLREPEGEFDVEASVEANLVYKKAASDAKKRRRETFLLEARQRKEEDRNQGFIKPWNGPVTQVNPNEHHLLNAADRFHSHRHGHECLPHEGSEVIKGIKYILRSDVMFMD